MKRKIRLTESDLHRVVKESVNTILNEIGDTTRGQYMLGRLRNRQLNGGGKFSRGINYNDAGDYAYNANNGGYSRDYLQGYDDETKYKRNDDSTWDRDKYSHIKFNYNAKELYDMDSIGRKFIQFIESDGSLLQKIVDYESGNENGTPSSPLNELIPEFENEVIGYECTPKMKNAIKRAYNQWWVYAQDQLMDDFDE